MIFSQWSKREGPVWAYGFVGGIMIIGGAVQASVSWTHAAGPHYLMSFAGITYMAFGIAMLRQGKRVHDRCVGRATELCDACGYHLTGNVSGVCPECGTRIRNRYEQAHTHSISHRDEVLRSQRCGCFYCKQVFDRAEISEWGDESGGVGQTALYPRCGIDAVIGSASGLPVTPEFLTRMHVYYFE